MLKNQIHEITLIMRILKSLILFAVLTFSIQAKDIRITETDNQFSITNKSLSEFTLVNHLSDINALKVQTKIGDFVKLVVPGYGEHASSGNAELPVIEKLINIPLGSEVVVKILNTEEKVIALSDYDISEKVFPSQPSISKGDNAAEAPFYFNNDYYIENKFHTHETITIERLGNMRGQQLARLSVAPFTYNPVTNELKIITKLEVKVLFKNIDLEGHKLNKEKYYSPEFESLYKKALNYMEPDLSKDVITTYPVKYVIISDPAFQNALQPLIDWKTKKGFMVVEGYTNDPLVGNTTSSIHNFLKNMYDNATANDPAPTYLLIVGDDAQVPSFSTALNYNHITDMYYCEFDGGGDFYPEMYYGRFSATIPEEVEIQVHKTLTHEQYTFSNPSFLDEIVLVAGDDNTFAVTHGNGQINYGTDNYFNVSHGLTIHNYLWGSGSPITSDDPAASGAIISNISEGVGFANYTAHCGSSGWSDPSFETSDIPGLQNIDEFGVLIGNCCQSNKFDVNVCFGEALLRADEKGAVGYIGGSNNTYWDEDFWWAVGNGSISANPTYSGTDLGVYDCLMHENGELESDWFITQGQMIHSGNLAVTQAGAQLEQYYWEIYHVMGDPSLMPYIGVPTLLSVSHNSATPLGTSTFSVTTEEHAYVAISMNGVLIDAQLADATGVVNLDLTSISNPGTADIVVTKQFKQPYQSTVQIISPTGPYVIYSNNTISDPTGNNNSLADYNELIEMIVDLENVGSVDATSINVDLSTTDPYITLLNSNINIPVINVAQILTTNIPFTFQVAAFVPDQHIAPFTLTMTDNLGNVWNGSVNVLLNAPVLDHTTFIVDDVTSGNGNGKLDAGETLDLIVNVTNIGHAEIANLTATLGSLSSYVSVNSATSNISALSVNQQQSTTFNISIAANTPIGTYAEFPFDISDGVYTHNNIFSEIIGIIDEDYETGDFTQYAWIQGTFPWTIDNINTYEGQNSSRSGAIPHNEESELSIEVDVTAAGDISFFKFLSSEQDYDFLKFKINGSKVGEWSGIDNAWSFVSFPVSPGVNTFKWEYEKDGGWADGQDCAWIDYIVFPPIDLGQTTNVDQNDFAFELFPNPTIGTFRLNFNDDNSHQVEIIDNNGKVILFMSNQRKFVNFDIQRYSAGTYTIKVMPEGVTYQIVKQ